MKVRATRQIAYASVGYIAGQEFEMKEADFERYQKDVEKVQIKKSKKTSSPRNKAVKSKTTK